MQVKICGMTRPEDIRAAVELGVDALGFVMYQESPRYVSPDRVRLMTEIIPSRVVTVGVFVNEDPRRVIEIADYCRLDMLQLHGDEPPEYAAGLPVSMVIKAFNPRGKEDIDQVLTYPAAAVLVDARDRGLYGGTGETSNWEAARLIGLSRPLVLAGGIGEDNIDEALSCVSPAAVDVNSSVERAPGIKDNEKMARVLKRVRVWEHKTSNKMRGPFVKRNGDP